MRWVRLWLPVGIIAFGLVLIVATGGSLEGIEGGAAVVGAGLSVWLLNFFFRVGVQGDRERDAEDEARRYFDEHGYWPDEAPPAAAEPPTFPESPPAEPSGSPHPPPAAHRPAAHPHRPPGRAGGPPRRPPRRP